ncbi:hypothetical protein M408DRAFT_19180 [Serendipita vermifera MAFF 305830]|uniref:Peptidase A1 domain-containing protein n=1 Tax=Serendipita vermifera MAFF 305830 TaxID=933852 RepID=A0A0C2XZF5_SERVB|nr:hypothetical protein M408DRAFT_19180 [Serendipita vermifera MAFF 305830]
MNPAGGVLAGVVLRYITQIITISVILLSVLNVTAKPLRDDHFDTTDRRNNAVRSTSTPLHLPLFRRVSSESLKEEEYGPWARLQGQSLNAKYGGAGGSMAKNNSALHPRTNGTAYLLNQNTDSAFYAPIGVGTPAVVMNVIIDTGSSDLWIAGSHCETGCESGLPRFDSNSSLTFQDADSSFSVRYGSASATGTLGRDMIQMAGYAVEDQLFAVVNSVTPGLLSTPVSGLMGLAFRGIAASGGTPFWNRVAAAKLWDKPLMSFCLTKFLGVAGATNLEPGGVFIMGGLNESLYTGEIDYTPLSSLGTYWQIPLVSLTVGNTTIDIPPEYTVGGIDTGTTLIGGPSDMIDRIAAQIPGSTPGTGDYENYFFYPCASAVGVSFSFGGRTWHIAPKDFQLLRMRNGSCVSAFFRLSIGEHAPKWIIGDTFLKNVYSVFQYEPTPRVGFADLSPIALGMSVPGHDLPTPSLGASVVIRGSAATASRSPSFLTLFCLLLTTGLALGTRTSLYY